MENRWLARYRFTSEYATFNPDDGFETLICPEDGAYTVVYVGDSAAEALDWDSSYEEHGAAVARSRVLQRKGLFTCLERVTPDHSKRKD